MAKPECTTFTVITQIWIQISGWFVCVVLAQYYSPDTRFLELFILEKNHAANTEYHILSQLAFTKKSWIEKLRPATYEHVKDGIFLSNEYAFISQW